MRSSYSQQSLLSSDSGVVVVEFHAVVVFGLVVVVAVVVLTKDLAPTAQVT